MLCPAAAVSALLPQATPCSRVSLLWQVASAMAGCVSNGSVASVGADCLSNGGRPPLTELHCPGFSCDRSETLYPECLESPFCLSHCAGPKAVSLKSPVLTHCPSPVQSDGYANLPSQVSDCRLNRAPGPVRFVRSAVEHCCAVALAAGCTSQHRCAGVPRLFYTWEFPRSVGNKDPSGNAALTHSPCVHQELQSWVVLTTPS